MIFADALSGTDVLYIAGASGGAAGVAGLIGPLLNFLLRYQEQRTKGQVELVTAEHNAEVNISKAQLEEEKRCRIKLETRLELVEKGQEECLRRERECLARDAEKAGQLAAFAQQLEIVRKDQVSISAATRQTAQKVDAVAVIQKQALADVDEIKKKVGNGS